MTSKTKPNALSNKQKRYWKQIISMAVKAAITEPGTIPTSYFKKLDTLVTKAKRKYPLETLDTSFGIEQSSEIESLITKSLGKNLTNEANFLDMIFLADDVRSIAHYANDIVECRNIIRFQSGLLSVDELYRASVILSKWIALDLLSFCWNDGFPICPDILGVLLTTVHWNGRVDGGCVEYFGAETASSMFDAASPEGINFFEPPIKQITGPVEAYRACILNEPAEAATGMTWTVDYEEAKGWASKHPFSGKVFPIIRSEFHPWEVLASYASSKEIIVYPGSNQEYSLVDPAGNIETETGLLETA